MEPGGPQCRKYSALYCSALSKQTCPDWQHWISRSHPLSLPDPAQRRQEECVPKFAWNRIYKKQTKTTVIGGCHRGTRVSWKSSQCPKWEPLEEENKVILDYNPKYEVNIHESTLTYMFYKRKLPWGNTTPTNTTSGRWPRSVSTVINHVVAYTFYRMWWKWHLMSAIILSKTLTPIYSWENSR